MQRVTIQYTGRVQGVGFRFTVRDIALGLGLVGWVRNNADGSVTLCAQGSGDQIEALRMRIRESGVGRIDGETEIPDASTAPTPTMLVLFDIDGTILRTFGLGVRAMGHAGRELHGQHFDEMRVEYAGRLDPLIIADLLVAHELEVHEDAVTDFRAMYGKHLGLILEQTPAELCPGVHELIDALEQTDGVTLGLLTGNYPETGAVKLRSGGIDPERFIIQVWGEDSPHDPPARTHLPPVGISRYLEKHQREIDPRDVVIIGDTPEDIGCAKASGCRCIAVATGKYSTGELAEAGADLAVEDLSGTEALVGWITRAEGEPNRILTIDVVRGVALLGIFAMNIMTFAMPFAAYMNPTAYPPVPFEGVNRWTYFIVHFVFDMKMMTLFSMLFGVGVMVYAEKISRGAEVSAVRRLWFKRMLILLCIGMVHAYFIWEGDILVSYAVAGMALLWWLRRLPAWAMVLIAVPFTIFPHLMWAQQGVAYHFMHVAESPPDWFIQATGIDEPENREKLLTNLEPLQEMMAPTPEQTAELEATYRGGYLTLLPYRAEQSFYMQAFMIPLFMLWRAAAMMLIGAALYKWRVVTGERSTSFYVKFTALNYLVGVPLLVGGMLYNDSIDFSPGLLIAIGMQFNAIGSVPMAMGHMGLIILIARAVPTALIVRSLSAVGRMALTNYLMHGIIASIIFYGYGFALYGQMDRLEQQMVVVAVWAAQLIWSPLWLKHFRFGPAEWAWRSLTYGKPQPMRRAAPAMQSPSAMKRGLNWLSAPQSGQTMPCSPAGSPLSDVPHVQHRSPITRLAVLLTVIVTAASATPTTGSVSHAGLSEITPNAANGMPMTYTISR
ncbi:yxaH, partial [Symbiodinium necroappetens]